jgi:integrator complex subunit 11
VLWLIDFITGAGQDVGKSCVIVTVGGKNVMFDCGMHMGFQDERRYPDFSFISKTGNYTQAIDCVIVTHFHLDHIGALPYFTEICGYEGPIYMTYPTKALAPLMLEDYRKVMVDRKGEQEQFSVLQIQQCMKRVTAIDLRQTIKVDADLEIRAYYAGHVRLSSFSILMLASPPCGVNPKVSGDGY